MIIGLAFLIIISCVIGFVLLQKNLSKPIAKEPKIINEYKVFFYDSTYPKYQTTPNSVHPIGTQLEEDRLVYAEDEELAKRLIQVYDFNKTRTITRVELVKENIKY